MPTYINGIPRDNGATDLEDSARLAGMLTAAGMAPGLGPSCYLNSTTKELARWSGSILPFTRDQLIPLAYFYKNMRTIDITGDIRMAGALLIASTKYTAPNGKDVLNPAHRSHLKACLGDSWSVAGKAFLVGEIAWHAFCVPTSEPNQLICMLLTAGPKYVRLWKRLNPKWRESISEYWCGWRAEPELAEALIVALAAV